MSDPSGAIDDADRTTDPSAGAGERAAEAVAAGPGLPGQAPDGDASDPERMERLDPVVVVYWLLSGAVSLAFLATLVTVGLLLFGSRLPGEGRVFTIAAIVAGALLALWTLVSPSLAYARWRFLITDELLLARYGIIFHEEKSIPITRLQHVDLTRGPIERLFGLATLVVYTAGTEGASFRVPGLRAQRARELRDAILVARGDDVI